MSSYDYVIVGAGSAGCVLAGRLSEDPDVSVVLLEAGGVDSAEEIHLPISWPELFKGPCDWDLDSEPEPGLNGRRIYLPRGKVLGGSSSTNAMIYVRGHPADFDGWAATGASGWGYEDVLPYFRRSEDNERAGDCYHGVGGPLAVSDGRSSHPLSRAFVDAAIQAGFSPNPDFNGHEQEGVGFFQLNQRNGLRCSAAAAFLAPASARPNLTIISDALAHRVIFSGPRAEGVEFSQAGVEERVMADREVIVSAGSYETPKLLMLSGVGPGDALQSHGLEVHADLPVGQGLQDHLLVFINYATDVESLMTAGSEQDVQLLERDGRGPLTSNLAEAGGFVHTRAGLDAPDCEFVVAPVMSYQENLGAPTTHAVALGPSVLAPSSRGQVTLRSLNPATAPRIQHNYLQTSEDRACIAAGLRITLDIAAQAALRDIITGPLDAPDSESEADLLAFASRVGLTFYHPTSSCSIGSVVDPELRVLGLDGLRVIDASVMPTIVRGNTHAATVMIAERGADLIRAAAAVKHESA